MKQIEHMQAAGWGGFGTVLESERVYCAPLMSYRRERSDIDCQSLATPSVWRSRDRSQTVARVDALSAGAMDEFEMPAFLRKKVVPPSKPRNIYPGPIATPLEILQAYEDIAVNQLAENRLVSTLQNLNIPDELATVLDDLTAQLGSGAKAWAVVIKWLGAALVDQIVLSRHGERLLRKVLKSVDADALDLAIRRVEKKFGSARAKWGPKRRTVRVAMTS